MANPNIPFLLKINTDLIIGAIIRHADDKAKKAQEVIDVCTALKTINEGDINEGIAALEAAMSLDPGEDPAKQQAIQTAITWIATKASAIQQALSGTLLGTLQTDLLNAALTEAATLAQKYLPKAQ